MRISDWSSDVCSSDLFAARARTARLGTGAGLRRRGGGGRRGLGGALGVAHRAPAERTPHRGPLHEDPADVRHGLATDEATLVEQPAVLAVELLEGVVRQDDSVGAIRALEQEGIAAADDARRRRAPLARPDGILEERSEERRVGKEVVSTWSSRWW